MKKNKDQQPNNTVSRPKQVHYTAFNTMFLSQIHDLENMGRGDIVKEIFELVDRAANYDSFPEFSSKDHHTYRIGDYLIHDIHPKHNINNNVTLLFTYSKVNNDQKNDKLYIYLNILAAPKDHKTGQDKVADNINYNSTETKIYYRQYDINVAGEPLPALSKTVRSSKGVDHTIEIVPEDYYGRPMWFIYVDSKLIAKKSECFSNIDKAKSHVESKVIPDILNNVYGSTIISNTNPDYEVFEYSTSDLIAALEKLIPKLSDSMYLVTSTYGDWKIIYRLTEYPYKYSVYFQNDRILQFSVVGHKYQVQFVSSDYDRSFRYGVSNTIETFLLLKDIIT